MPVIFFGVFDQDTTKDVSAASPHLYEPGLRKSLYTNKGFVRWMVEATILAAAATYLPILCVRTMQGGDPSVDELSFTTMFLVVLCTNLRPVLEVHSWGALQHLGLWGSLVVLEISCLIFSYSFYSDAWPRTYDWNGFRGLVPLFYEEVRRVTLLVTVRVTASVASCPSSTRRCAV